jgi:hypothetical protein
MLFSASLLAILACEENFDKDGEEITIDPSDEEDGEPSIEINPDDPDDPNHDWDDDGFTENEGDCNDYNQHINPDIEETYYNDIDENCDGLSDFDADQDGFEAYSWGGDDCDDGNDAAFPGAPEDPFDGIDTDCDWQPDPRFVTEEIDPNTLIANGHNALGIDNLGKIHVVYEDDHQLWYTNSEELGQWRTPTLLKFNDNFDLATDGLDGVMDNVNRFHIAFTSRNTNTGALAAQYAYMPTTGNWTDQFEIDGQNTTQSTQVGYYIDIDMGPDRLPVFGYYNQNTERPMITKISTLPNSGQNPSFIYRHEADYLVYNISGQGTGQHTALTVDSNNRSHLVFLDNTAPYGTGSSPQSQYSSYGDVSTICESQIVAQPGGYWHSAAVRPDGNVCVAYQDINTLTLKYACQNSSSCTGWTIQDIDYASGTGAYASLAFNSQAQPYIAYYDSTIGALKVATQVGLNWELEVVDDQGNKDVGRYTNIVIDADDFVHITYYNVTDRKIWHALGR